MYVYVIISLSHIKNQAYGSYLTRRQTQSNLSRRPIQPLEELIPKVLTAIIEPQLTVDSADLLHILRIELEVGLDVLLDALGRLGLGEDRVAFVYCPCWLPR
jgi:hypothetical protein